METIQWHDFERVLLVAGTVREVAPFAQARKPAYRIRVDFGPYGVLKTSAQVTALYAPGDLVGRQVVGVVNLAPKQIGPVRSEFLLTGFETPDGVVITTLERPVPDGTRMS